MTLHLDVERPPNGTLDLRWGSGLEQVSRPVVVRLCRANGDNRDNRDNQVIASAREDSCWTE